MTKVISLVTTDELLAKLFPERRTTLNSASRAPGVLVADFDVDSSACKSKFATWLAENILTTERHEDCSIVNVTLPTSEEDIHVREFASELSRSRLRSLSEMERLHDRMQAWIEKRKAMARAYAEDQFRLRTIVYDWPVLGSRAAEGIEDPVAYFDMCAGRIRSMNPVRVALWGGSEPPESFQVCKSGALPLFNPSLADHR